jgi:hypothetical protein
VFHQRRACDDVHVQVENYALDVKNNEEKVVMGYDSELPFVGLAFKLEACQQGGPTGARTTGGPIVDGWPRPCCLLSVRGILKCGLRVVIGQSHDLARCGLAEHTLTRAPRMACRRGAMGS